MSYEMTDKERAIAYYQENKVPLKMQDVLNTMFHENPQDVNSFVSTYFEQFSIPPVISSIKTTKTFDSKGQPAVCVKIYCTVKNCEKLVGQASLAIDTTLLDNCKAEEKEAEDCARLKAVEDAIKLIDEQYAFLIQMNPCHQQALDDQIYKVVEGERLKIEAEEAAAEVAAAALEEEAAVQDDKKGGKKSAKSSAKKKGSQVVIVADKKMEKPYPGWHAVCVVSKAISCVGASLTDKPLFDYLLSTFGSDEMKVHLPLPMFTLLHSGKAALGKNNCVKEFMIVPRPDMSTSEAIRLACQMQEYICKTLLVKNGVAIKNVNDIGVICPLLDKPEQGLDMIIDAANQSEMKMGEDFFFILNSSAHECFDYEKGKYEVMTGLVKTFEDMADFWLDLTNRYPAIIGLIDPLRVEEKPQWNRIATVISEKCLIISERGFNRPGCLIDEDVDVAEFATSGIVMKQDKCNTVSHLIESSKKMRDSDCVVILSSGQHETNDTTLIDLAIACQARYVKLGGLNRGERIVKFNQMIEYEQEYKDRLSQWDPLNMKLIPPPAPPTPEPEAEEVQPAE